MGGGEVETAHSGDLRTNFKRYLQDESNTRIADLIADFAHLVPHQDRDDRHIPGPSNIPSGISSDASMFSKFTRE